MLLAKRKVLQKIVDSGLVAVVRAESCEQAARTERACLEGGLGAVGITFTQTEGTVLDFEMARTDLLAGVHFVIGPSLSTDAALV